MPAPKPARAQFFMELRALPVFGRILAYLTYKALVIPSKFAIGIAVLRYCILKAPIFGPWPRDASYLSNLFAFMYPQLGWPSKNTLPFLISAAWIPCETLIHKVLAKLVLRPLAARRLNDFVDLLETEYSMGVLASDLRDSDILDNVVPREGAFLTYVYIEWTWWHFWRGRNTVKGTPLNRLLIDLDLTLHFLRNGRVRGNTEYGFFAMTDRDVVAFMENRKWKERKEIIMRRLDEEKIRIGSLDSDITASPRTSSSLEMQAQRENDLRP